MTPKCSGDWLFTKTNGCQIWMAPDNKTKDTLPGKKTAITLTVRRAVSVHFLSCAERGRHQGFPHKSLGVCGTTLKKAKTMNFFWLSVAALWLLGPGGGGGQYYALARGNVDQQVNNNDDEPVSAWDVLVEPNPPPPPSSGGGDAFPNDIGDGDEDGDYDKFDPALRVSVNHAYLSNLLSNDNTYPISLSFPGVDMLVGKKNSNDDDNDDNDENQETPIAGNNVSPLVQCNFIPSNVSHPDLAAKYPEIVELIGTCQGGISTATLVYNTNTEGYLSVSFSPQDQYQSPILSFRQTLESDVGEDTVINPNEYKLLAYQDIDLKDLANVQFGEPPKVITSGTTTTTPGPDGLHDRNLQDLVYSQVATFQIAVAATYEFSSTITGSASPARADVHTQVVAIFARVNALYIREVGVFFQLVATNDQLYCLGEAFCNTWSNDATGANLALVDDYIAQAAAGNSIGTPASDLNHLLKRDPPPASGSQGSGIAVRPSLCGGGNAQNGISGWSSQAGLQGELLQIILVHELGKLFAFAPVCRSHVFILLFQP